MGRLVSGLFGRGGSGIANQGIQEGARRAEQAYFRPYTVTTGTGTTAYQDGQLTAALSLSCLLFKVAPSVLQVSSYHSLQH